MANSNLIDNNTVLTFNKIKQIHSTLFPFEKDLKNYHKRALQNAEVLGLDALACGLCALKKMYPLQA